jgi:hypothetical protein
LTVVFWGKVALANIGRVWVPIGAFWVEIVNLEMPFSLGDK